MDGGYGLGAAPYKGLRGGGGDKRAGERRPRPLSEHAPTKPTRAWGAARAQAVGIPGRASQSAEPGGRAEGQGCPLPAGRAQQGAPRGVGSPETRGQRG